MEVSSRWTGRRGVSLPFTDFCPFVAATAAAREALCQHILNYGRERSWRYFECRSNDFQCPGAEPSVGFYGHSVEFKGNPALLFEKFEGAVRRGIRKAEQAGLRVEFGVTTEAMREYYSLHCQTRRKHGVPPQPGKFFESIHRNVIGAGHGFVASVRHEGRPIAAAVFFHYGREAVYKFGASDHRFQHLRANNLVMWESMKRCAELGSEILHLGRTSLGQEGLRRFKLGFGAREERLNYYRYDYGRQAFVAGVDRANSRVTRLFKCLPAPLFRLAGRLLYPHLS